MAPRAAPVSPLALEVLGIGAWSAAYHDWPSMREALRGTVGATCPGVAARPRPGLLPAAERRRMPDGVAVAIEVANEAIVAAGSHIDPTTVASIFTSAHGDLAIVDYLCTQLATDPASLSPTRFHLSVHNAAAGYWSIARRNHAPTSAIAAGDDSFALGLLEAATLATAEDRPVLLVAFDTPATGLLAAAVANRALFGFAIAVRPAGDAPSGPVITMTVDGATSPLPDLRVAGLRDLAHSSAAARALCLAELIAIGGGNDVRYPVGSGTTLSIRLRDRDARAR